jgi:hypothetical protein
METLGVVRCNDRRILHIVRNRMYSNRPRLARCLDDLAISGRIGADIVASVRKQNVEPDGRVRTQSPVLLGPRTHVGVERPVTPVLVVAPVAGEGDGAVEVPSKVKSAVA